MDAFPGMMPCRTDGIPPASCSRTWTEMQTAAKQFKYLQPEGWKCFSALASGRAGLASFRRFRRPVLESAAVPPAGAFLHSAWFRLRRPGLGAAAGPACLSLAKSGLQSAAPSCMAGLKEKDHSLLPEAAGELAAMPSGCWRRPEKAGGG